MSTARAHDGLRPGQRRGCHGGGWRLAAAAAFWIAFSAQLSLGHAHASQFVGENVPVSGAQPVWLEIPRIGVGAEIVPLGLEEDGAMAAPTDPDTVGWFELGAGIGAPGNVLLDGHVDWGGRLRVFGQLNQLEPGDVIRVSEPGGALLSYSVSWTRFFPDADAAPLDEIFGQIEPAEELTLITCGGSFDASIGMYRGRWVVRAARTVDDAVSSD